MSSNDETQTGGGWQSFIKIWFGQIVSMLGSGLTNFALGVWVYEKTGSTTQFALIFVFGALPAIFAAPLVGTLVDRWDRRWTMILSDSGTAVAALILVGLLWVDQLAVWHIYGVVVFAALMMSFQIPAFTAAIPLLVPREQLGRVAGLMQFGPAASRILAPLLAGILMPIVSLRGVIAIDLATFAFAVVMTLLAKIPAPPRSASAASEAPSIWREMAAGWRYLVERPAFVGLIVFFAVINLVFGFVQVLATPLVLSFTGTTGLGVVLSLGSVGLLVGSLLMGAWGGPKDRVLGIVGAAPVLALGMILTGLLPSIPLIAFGYFLCFFTVPIMNGCDQAIFQVKVPPELQGRVFAFKRMFSQITLPVAYLLAGPLSDAYFEPGMAEGGSLASTFGGLFGTGPGRGIGLLLVLLGAMQAVTALVAFLSPRIRGAQAQLPDAVPETPEAAAQ